jgi:hypothetical protein
MKAIYIQDTELHVVNNLILIVDVPIHSNKAGLCYRKGEKEDRTGKVKKGNAKTDNESKKLKCKHESIKHKTKAKTVVEKVKTNSLSL